MPLFKKNRKPGWYMAPPPDGMDRERYWDGKAWTDRTRPRVETPPLHDDYLAGAYEHRFSTEGSKTWRSMSDEDQARASYESRVADPTTLEHTKRRLELEEHEHYEALQTRRRETKERRATLIAAAIESAAPVIADAIVAAGGHRPVKSFLGFALHEDSKNLSATVAHADDRSPHTTDVTVPLRGVIDAEVASRFGSSVGTESRALQQSTLAHLHHLIEDHTTTSATTDERVVAVDDHERAVAALAEHLRAHLMPRVAPGADLAFAVRRINLALTGTGRGVAEIRYVDSDDEVSTLVDITDPAILELLRSGDHAAIDAVRRQMSIRVGGT